MSSFIKYKRLVKYFDITDDTKFESELTEFFDDLILNGWNIIYYDEEEEAYFFNKKVDIATPINTTINFDVNYSTLKKYLKVTVVLGKEYQKI